MFTRQASSLGSVRARPSRSWRPVVSASRSHYDVLGVPETASEKEIKTAFRKIALKHHPDVNKEAVAQKTFMKAKAAYEVLSDGRARAMYDVELQQGSSSSSTQWGGSSGEYNDIGFGGDFSSLEELLQMMGIMEDESAGGRGQAGVVWDTQEWIVEDGHSEGASFTFVIDESEGYSRVMPWLHMMADDDDDEDNVRTFMGTSQSTRTSSRTSSSSSKRAASSSTSSTSSSRRQGPKAEARRGPRAAAVEEEDPMAIIAEILDNLPEREQRIFLRQLDKVETEEELAWLVDKYQSVTAHSFQAREDALFQQLDDMFGRNHWKTAGGSRAQGFQPDVSELFGGSLGERERVAPRKPTRGGKAGKRATRRR